MWLLIIVLLLSAGLVGTVPGADEGGPPPPERPGWAPAAEYVDPAGRFAIVPPPGWSAMDDPSGRAGCSSP